MISYLIVSAVSFVAGGIVSYFFVRRNPAAIAKVQAVSAAVTTTTSSK